MRFNILLLLCVVGEFSELGDERIREGVGCGKGGGVTAALGPSLSP